MNILVSECVAAALDEMDLGPAEYAKAYAIAIRGWRELNWDIVGNIKQVNLKICGDCTAKLPDDFISESFIGVPDESGCCPSGGKYGAIALTRATNMATVDYPASRFIVRDHDQTNLATPYNSPGGNGSLGVGSYGVIGYFYIDKAKHLISVSPDLPYSTIVLRYLSYTGEGEEYEINELASEALIGI